MVAVWRDESYLGRAFLFLAKLWEYPTLLSEEVFQTLECLSADLGLSSPQEGLRSSLLELQEEYTRLFINAPFGVPAPPYASVYRGGGLLCQAPLEEAMCFYQEAGLFPATDGEPADHLAYELAFVAFLLEQGNHPLLRDFLHKHLLRWFPAFKQALWRADPPAFYKVLASLTEVLLFKLNEEVCS